MKFIQYLIEYSIKNGRHVLTYQKLLHALDTTHLTQKDDSYSFNLGTAVKDSTLNDLDVVIKQGPSDVRLGKKSDGRMVVVITVPKLPTVRTELDAVLSKDEALMKSFVDSISTFYDNYRDTTKEVEPSNHEKTEGLHDSGTVEENYKKLVDAMDKLNAEYKAALESMTKNDNSANLFKNVTNDLAKEKLKASYFGNSDGEFVKMMMKLPEAAFIKLLQKDDSKKILDRLESYKAQMS